MGYVECSGYARKDQPVSVVRGIVWQDISIVARGHAHDADGSYFGKQRKDASESLKNGLDGGAR